MRYLRLVILVSIFGFGLNTAAFAICCPAGCVKNGYGACWRSGTNNYCSPTTCPGSPGSSGGSSHGPPAAGPPGVPPAPCARINLTPASRDARTNQCITELRARAQFYACWLEDDAGRAEDLRTGLSCPDRQAALATQCRARCAKFAMFESSCSSTDQVWQASFGDIGGDRFGSASIDRCGPRLRSDPVVRLQVGNRPYTPRSPYVSQIRNRPYTP